MSFGVSTFVVLAAIAAGVAALAFNVRTTRGRRSKAPFSLALLVGMFLAVVVAFAAPPLPGRVLDSASRMVLAFLLPQFVLRLRDRHRRRRRSDRPVLATARPGRRPARR